MAVGGGMLVNGSWAKRVCDEWLVGGEKWMRVSGWLKVRKSWR